LTDRCECHEQDVPSHSRFQRKRENGLPSAWKREKLPNNQPASQPTIYHDKGGCQESFLSSGTAAMSRPQWLWCHISSPDMMILSLPALRPAGPRLPCSGTKRPDRTPCPPDGCCLVPIPAIAAEDEVARLGHESLLPFILRVKGESILALFLATSPKIREIRSVTLQESVV